MSTETNKKPLINAHTHIFTGNFVPPYLTKSIIPSPFHKLLPTGMILNLIKLYYKRKHEKQYGNSKENLEDAILKNEIYADRRGKRAEMEKNYSISSSTFWSGLFFVVKFWFTLIAALYLAEIIALILGELPYDWIQKIIATLKSIWLYFNISIWVKIIWVFSVFFFVRSSRKILLAVVKSLIPVLKKVLNQQIIDLAERYWLLGRFSFYETQSKVSQRVLHQLPDKSEIVILPMDMEYMDAGKTKLTKKILDSKAKKLANDWEEKDFDDSFKYQMRELWDLVKKKDRSGPKDKYHPFLFIDPRRVKYENAYADEKFFDFELVRSDKDGTICKHGKSCKECQHNRMVLNKCFVKTYMEDRRFSGFKIYPALGYYPFDEELLPIWRYAAENDIPIMTHCVKGVIYYRGKKLEDWNLHPVFKMKYRFDEGDPEDIEMIQKLEDIYQNDENQPAYEPMMLPEKKPVDFQVNFTHPLNYLCLVEEKFLKMLIAKSKDDSEVREVFGYDPANDSVQYNLKNLKICLAHFGGEGEWNRFMEQDRNVYSQRIMRDPEVALKFMKNSDGKFSWDKINGLWTKADWYSIISSLLIRYDNIYADISYIVSKPSIFPLLIYSLEKGEGYKTQHEAYLEEEDPNKKARHYTGKNKLRSRILFGTDFYVVRNHKSDKNMFIQTVAELGTENFDLIARENTHNYLSRKYPSI